MPGAWGYLWAIRDPLLSGAQSGPQLITPVGPDTCLAIGRPWATTDTSLNFYHNHASSTNCPDKEVPIFRDSQWDEEHAFPQIVCWNIANGVWPLGCLLKKSFSAVLFWLHVQHRCLRSFIIQLLSSFMLFFESQHCLYFHVIYSMIVLIMMWFCGYRLNEHVVYVPEYNALNQQPEMCRKLIMRRIHYRY